MFFILVICILQLVHYCDGNQRVVYISESISNDDNSSEFKDICRVYGKCSCSSLDHALADLNNTSNVLINITTDVTLSSLIKVLYIENATIIRHNDPTVNCTNPGGIHFGFCHNCIIEGIIWDGCGVDNIDNHTEPGLKMSNSSSSNVTMKNCSFQYSRGQVVLLSNLSGDVHISHCNFVHNNHYKGHGAAIHYSSNNIISFYQLTLFTINDCNFTDNKHAKSLVYIENRISKHNLTIHRQL